MRGSTVLGSTCLFLLCLCTNMAISQDRLVIPRLHGEISFDGMVNEPAWDSIDPLPMVTHEPVFGKEPSEKTESRIVYSQDYIYVSARLYDREPEKIMSTSRKRDEMSSGNDWFLVMFDTFNDKENALVFGTTPSGLRLDYSVFRDAMVQVPESPFNVDWNTFWDVKTTRDSLGWYVEMRIPISSMRFKDENDVAVMGLTCLRYIAHRNEIVVFPAIPPDWGMYSAYRPSQSREVVFHNIHSKKPFYITPFILGGIQQETRLNEEQNGYVLESDPQLNTGADIKYGLTNNMTLDVTINTDFAQVEADDQEINLTRFSLFFPEKRSFFQERSSIFSFDFEEGNHMFYSRRIGLSGGEQVPIYGGIRLTGMTGKWDLGLLDMQTQKFIPDKDGSNGLPSENFGILRIKRNILNENSYIGGVAISRLGMNGRYNVSYGADANLKLFGDDYLNVKLAQVADDSVRHRIWSANPMQVYINWKRFKDNGFGYNFIFSRTGKDFRPEAGFRMRDDYSYARGSMGYGWFSSESSRLKKNGIELFFSNYHSNATGETESMYMGGGYYFVLKSNMFAYSGINHQYENVIDSFSFGDVAYIPPGGYRFNLFEFHGQTSESRSFFLAVDLWAGSFYDGNRFSVNLGPHWNISQSLQLKAEYNFDRLRFSDRGQKFDGHVLRLRSLLMFSTKLSASAFVQFSNSDNLIVANFRLRYNPREGNDFYVVYNEGRNTSLDRELPHLPSLSDRTVLLKYTYTFTLRK